jgi:hypothetical protein
LGPFAFSDQGEVGPLLPLSLHVSPSFCTLGLSCQPFFVRSRTGCSFTRRTVAHVHVEREEAKAKFWLEPVRLETSRGFGRAEIVRIERLVAENAALLLRLWHEYFGR